MEVKTSHYDKNDMIVIEKHNITDEEIAKLHVIQAYNITGHEQYHIVLKESAEGFIVSGGGLDKEDVIHDYFWRKLNNLSQCNYQVLHKELVK